LAVTSVVVTGLGMASSLGPSRSACAAARAGLSRPEVGPYRITVTEEDMRDQVTIYPCRGIADESATARMAPLIARAAQDLTRTAGENPEPLTCLMNVPATCAPTVIATALPPEWTSRSPTIGAHGHAGAIAFVAEACAKLADGRARAAIVGGVDSHIDRDLLAELDARRVLKTPRNGDGFIPGEGAAFLRLERREDAEARGAPILAELGSLAMDRAEYSFDDEDFVPTGAAWERALVRALEDNPARAGDIGDVVHDYNGWSRRGREWALALMRIRRRFAQLAEARRTTLAECFGDLGAASAAFGLCTSVTALSRGYAQGREILLAAASDDGRRAAAIVRSAT
jgi:3-oxoacyl-[acyl-carrier-protein] synthase I